MINAQDLKIGNIVQVKNVTGYQRVTGTDSKPMKDGIYYQIKVGDQWYIPAHVSPVVLTSIILEDCGFKKNAGDMVLDWFKLFSGHQEWWFGWNIPAPARINIKIEYLHELQNLYLWLCGEELNITPLNSTHD